MKISKWQRTRSEIEFQNKRIKVRKDFFLLPTGIETDYCILERGIVVGILPITKKQEVVVVEQYRPAVDEITIDIPGGAVHYWEGETPVEAAKRELKEETGYVAKSIHQLSGILFTDSGRSDQKRYIFLAEDLITGETKLEETEFIKVKKIPIEKLYREIIKGKIKETTLSLSLSLYLLQKSSFNKYPKGLK